MMDIEKYREQWLKESHTLMRRATALGMTFYSESDTGKVTLTLHLHRFEFDGLTAAKTAVAMLELERQPHV